MATSKAIEQIRKDEGFSKKAEHILLKSGKREKNLTIGHGFNLSQSDAKEDLLLAGVNPNDIDSIMSGKMEITKEQADSLLNVQLQQAQKDVKGLVKDFGKLPQTVQDVLTNMSYQLGRGRLKGFDKMIEAVNDRDWPTMKKEMLKSDWAKQTPSRAKRLSTQIGGVKVEPKAPTTAVGQQRSATELYQKQQHDSRVTSIADIMSRQNLVSEMADTLGKSQEAEKEETPTTTNEPEEKANAN